MLSRGCCLQTSVAKLFRALKLLEGQLRIQLPEVRSRCSNPCRSAMVLLVVTPGCMSHKELGSLPLHAQCCCMQSVLLKSTEPGRNGVVSLVRTNN